MPGQDVFKPSITLRLLLVTSAVALVVAMAAAWLCRPTLAQPGDAFIREQWHHIAWIAVLAVALSGGAARLLQGTLAADFHRMAQALERYEGSHRQWAIDTSHELRTPLTVLGTQLQAMRDGVLPATPEKLALLSDTVRNMEQLVAALHELAQADAGTQDNPHRPLPVADLLDELESRFAPRFAEQALSLRIHNAAGPDARICGDRVRLLEALQQLLSNSLRYTDAGGQTRIDARVRQGWLQLAVEDSSPGVPAEALPRLFDRFFRVDASRNRRSGGPGLGLALCKAIVNAHGGTIAAHTSALGGLNITIVLPLADRTLPH